MNDKQNVNSNLFFFLITQICKALDHLEAFVWYVSNPVYLLIYRTASRGFHITHQHKLQLYVHAIIHTWLTAIHYEQGKFQCNNYVGKYIGLGNLYIEIHIYCAIHNISQF